MKCLISDCSNASDSGLYCHGCRARLESGNPFISGSAVAFTDPVSAPSHYTDGDIECIDAIRSALGEEGFNSYCRGMVMKYTWRGGRGPKDAKRDAAQAKFFAVFVAGGDPRK